MKLFRTKWLSSLLLFTFTWTFIVVPSYTPTTLRQFTLSWFEMLTSLLSPREASAQTAPDPLAYTINKIPGNFIDISATGAEVTPILGDDGALSSVSIGFPFEFFDGIFNAVTITANGYLAFSPHSIPQNIPIPSVSFPNGFIAPFWDDLNPEHNPASAIYYETLGSVPNRLFLIQWQDVPLKTDPDSRLTFQVILFESSNEIQFHYLSMVDGAGGVGLGRVSGSSATIGIESHDGSKGNEVAHNKESAVAGGYAFSFTRGGNGFAAERKLGDLDGDGRVTILDQSILTDVIAGVDSPRSSLDLVLADVSPHPGTSGRAFGNAIINAFDHERVFEALMGRETLNPTLSELSSYIAPPGESLTISGSGFDPVAANNMVVFVDTDGNETTVSAASVNFAGTELTVTVPSVLSGTHLASLWVDSNGLDSNSHDFALEGIPVIASLSPDFGDEGEIVHIRGYEFGPTPADNQVIFNGIPAAVGGVSATDGFDELIVTVPPDVETGPVTVAVAGEESNQVIFSYDGPPVVAFSTPEEGGEVTSPTEIIGTASDRALVGYRLEYAPLGGTFTTVEEGKNNIIDSVLGKVDPTLALNGIYQLRLSAIDESGNSSSVTQDILFAGNLKVGINRITFTDLQVPVSGIPITIRRTYDSRVKSKKDFGVGWSVDVLDVELQENRVPGEGWYMVDEGILLPNWKLKSSSIHLVLVRFPDGKTDVFEMKARFRTPALGAGDTAYVVFEPRPGTTSTLSPIAGDDMWFSNSQLVDWITYELYDPEEYILTTKDGTKLHIKQETGLKSIEDLNGNKLTIGSNGITHSSGKSITFYRDSQGRINYIYDPTNRYIRYTYDDKGDLVSVVDREYQTIKYVYDNDHNLIDIIDPRDVKAFSAEYNEDGRLVATKDANGNRIEIEHDIQNYQDMITDRLGQSTVYKYDERGNIVNETDPLGNTTSYTYDEQGNLLSRTDPLGSSTTYTYDSRGNRLAITDPLGNITSYTYNSRGQALTITDPLGNTTTNTYDIRGNLLTTTDSLGHTSSYEYDSWGNRIQATDPEGNSTSYEYDAHGWLIKETSECGVQTQYSYDSNGYQSQQIVTWTTPSGAQDTVTVYQHDREGRQTRTIYADGLSTVLEYDALGNNQASVDKLGRRTTYTYTPTGLLSRITYPDGSSELFTYDAEGRQTSHTNADGNTTTYVFDALGRQIRTIHADGSSTSKEYDAAGRIHSRTDERGNTTTHMYDTAGRLTSTTNALGETTGYTYDANGRVITTTMPNGQIYTYEYDAKGRRIKTIYPDGTFEESTYGSAYGLTAKKDQAGLTTNYTYAACGRLAEVIDAMGNTTAYSYDQRGKRISQTDANGHITSWEYDLFGRLTQHTLPLSMSETMNYDAVGNLVSRTDFNGSTTTYTYDNRNRRTRIDYPDGSSVSYTYTQGGQIESVTDSRGVTAYSYDARGRLLERDDPGDTVISYTYDSAGNRTTVTVPSGTTAYTFDALNRLETVTDPNGGITRYEYDNAGNLISVTYPNGAVANYEYDALNRLTYLENNRSDLGLISSYTYTLGSIGNRLRVAENSGRTVDYTYDDLYRLVQEDITDPILGSQIISNAYDSVGNRLSRTDSSGVTNYVYDANDRLLNEGTLNYTYDNNGNTLSKIDGADVTTYNYDSENRLVSVQTPNYAVDYFYDMDGIRVSSSVDGNLKSYVVDKNRRYAQVLEERDSSGSLLASYVYGNDLVSRQQGTEIEYYHYDGHGSVRQLTDENEILTDSYTYEGFGKLLSHDGTSTNTYLYVGEQFDSKVEQYYLRARYYEPELGRFLTVDPAPGVLAEPQSLNRYVYSLNDPINKLDPSGQYTLIGLMVGVVILGILATTCASHVAHRNQTLLIDVEYWDNSRDEILGMFDVQSILNIGINQARAYFQPYDIEISRSSREPSDPRYEKQFSILGTCEGRGMACHLEWFGSSGDPPGAFLTNIVHYYLINKGFSPGADSEIGSFLGATIAHEAGHLYGLSHGHCEGSRYIMWTAEVCGEDENASRLEDEISGNLSWSPDSQEVLEEVLGLRH